jgi:hypothetical protein
MILAFDGVDVPFLAAVDVPSCAKDGNEKPTHIIEIVAADKIAFLEIMSILLCAGYRLAVVKQVVEVVVFMR